MMRRTSSAERFILTATAVDLWLTTEDGVPESRLGELRRVLSEDEIERLERFKFAKDRRLFLVAHAHLRKVLSRYAAVEPQAWQFRKSAYGRPEISTEVHGLGLFFSLSHTAGLVAVAVSRFAEVGVDVENLHRREDFRELAQIVFSLAERERLASLPEEQYRSRFLELWTLKEAYAKARGLGLSLSFEEISFEVRDGKGKLCVSTETGAREEDGWQFHLHLPTADHQLALAVRRTDAEVTVRWRLA